MSTILEITRRLQKARKQHALAHAYIVHGHDIELRNAFMHDFAQELLCQDFSGAACKKCSSCRQFASRLHPDFLSLNVEISSLGGVGINEIRAAVRFARFSRVGSGCKVIAIFGADHLSMASANALLKTLEEPNQHVMILLGSSDVKKIPLTIVSRCQVLRIDASSTYATPAYMREEEKNILTVLIGPLEEKLLYIRNFMRKVRPNGQEATASDATKAITDFTASVENVLRASMLQIVMNDAIPANAENEVVRAIIRANPIRQITRALEATRHLRVILANRVNPSLAFESYALALAL